MNEATIRAQLARLHQINHLQTGENKRQSSETIARLERQLEELPPERWAVLRAASQHEVEAYLPDNYEVLSTSSLPDGKVDVVIGGRDSCGWTLNDYVIPRLHSGMLYAREYASYADANEAAAAAMN